MIGYVSDHGEYPDFRRYGRAWLWFWLPRWAERRVVKGGFWRYHDLTKGFVDSGWVLRRRMVVRDKPRHDYTCHCRDCCTHPTRWVALRRFRRPPFSMRGIY